MAERDEEPLPENDAGPLEDQEMADEAARALLDQARALQGEDGFSETTSLGHHRPTWAQTRYLLRGVKQAGGKLPLFDEEGQQIDIRTIRSCIERGWAEPWFRNPIKPDWLVCRLTAEGYRIVGYRKPKS